MVGSCGRVVRVSSWQTEAARREREIVSNYLKTLMSSQPAALASHALL